MPGVESGGRLHRVQVHGQQAQRGLAGRPCVVLWLVHVHARVPHVGALVVRRAAPHPVHPVQRVVECLVCARFEVHIRVAEHGGGEEGDARGGVERGPHDACVLVPARLGVLLFARHRPAPDQVVERVLVVQVDGRVPAQPLGEKRLAVRPLLDEVHACVDGQEGRGAALQVPLRVHVLRGHVVQRQHHVRRILPAADEPHEERVRVTEPRDVTVGVHHVEPEVIHHLDDLHLVPRGFMPVLTAPLRVALTMMHFVSDLGELWNEAVLHTEQTKPHRCLLVKSCNPLICYSCLLT
mmetsp:Transcript_35313/g.89387  ORF Transcript_35313/g.89387 Transcript_35313/m.89387 type:complete len:295 (-) Transcript_35313:226-1110(-)